MGLNRSPGFTVYILEEYRSVRTEPFLTEGIDMKEKKLRYTSASLLQCKQKCIFAHLENTWASKKLSGLATLRHTHYYCSNLILRTVSSRVDELMSSDHKRREAMISAHL